MKKERLQWKKSKKVLTKNKTEQQQNEISLERFSDLFCNIIVIAIQKKKIK